MDETHQNVPHLHLQMPACAKPEEKRITEPHGPDYDRLSAIATLGFDIFFKAPAYKNITP